MTEDELELKILERYTAHYRAVSRTDPTRSNKCLRELDLRQVLADLTAATGGDLDLEGRIWLGRLAPDVRGDMRGPLRRCSDGSKNRGEHAFHVRAFEGAFPHPAPAWDRIRELRRSLQSQSSMGMASNPESVRPTPADAQPKPASPSPDSAWISPKWRQNLTDKIIAAIVVTVLTVAGTAMLGWWKGWWFGTKTSYAVSVECKPEITPIYGAQGESLYAVFLHPKWGNQLVQSMFRNGPSGQKSIWPGPDVKERIAYVCDVTNHSETPLSITGFPIHVTFRSDQAKIRERVVTVGFPDYITPKNHFRIHLADDTGWNPVAALPDIVTGRGPGGATESIHVDYASSSGKRTTLSGFGPFDSKP
jgi:hypothetical protein